MTLSHPDELRFHPSLLKEKNYDTFTTHLKNAVYAYKTIPNYKVLGPRTSLLSVFPAADINDFPVILDEVVKQEQDIEKIGDSDRIELVEEHVDLHVQRETITWHLISRKPGTFSQGKPGNAAVQEYSMHLRNVMKDPVYPGHNILFYGQYMDNVIQITCWAPKGRTANNRAIWLEKVIDKYRWYFLYRGINRVLFRERTRDMLSKHGENKLEGRPLIYYVLTEKIVPIRVATLKEIIFNVRGPTVPELRDKLF